MEQMNKPGRPRKEVDVTAVKARLDQGESIKAVATSLGMSPITLRKRMKECLSAQ